MRTPDGKYEINALGEIVIPSKELTMEDRKKLKFCCESLKHQVMNFCPQEGHGFRCPDNLIQIGCNPDLSHWWVGEAPNASYEIKFCPWCGAKLPSLKTP